MRMSGCNASASCAKSHGRNTSSFYVIFGNIDRAIDRLAKRAHPKLQLIAGPGLLFDAEQMSEARASAAEPVLQAAARLLFAEPVRNGDDKRL